LGRRSQKDDPRHQIKRPLIKISDTPTVALQGERACSPKQTAFVAAQALATPAIKTDSPDDYFAGGHQRNFNSGTRQNPCDSDHFLFLASLLGVKFAVEVASPVKTNSISACGEMPRNLARTGESGLNKKFQFLGKSI